MLWKFFLKTWPRFLAGTGMTLMASAVTVFFGTIFGSLVCLMRMSKSKIFRLISGAYIEVIRGTPILLQLWLFYLLPNSLGLKVPELACILFALVVNSTAYVAELIRSGIQSVDFGQTEAARSLGMSQGQTMMKIVLPQAIRNILPALGNEFVMIIKETSLMSTFMAGDIMTVRSQMTAAYFLTIEPLIIAGAIYFVLTFVLSKAIGAFERRMARSD
ncbi:MAG: amino acid ABC transporter permease [Clostridiales bacterium]|nr:amino acid ABC transporter permease [Clostridiales bacterium]